MNLPNKLTTLRVIIFVFVFFLSGRMVKTVPSHNCTGTVYHSQPDRSSGWKDCQKVQSGYELWKIYGSARGQASSVLGAHLSDRAERASSQMVIVIISQEFIISGFRLIASDKQLSSPPAIGANLRRRFRWYRWCY